MIGDALATSLSTEKDVDKFAIKSVGPKMGNHWCFDQCKSRAGVALFWTLSLQEVGEAKLLAISGKFSGALL